MDVHSNARLFAAWILFMSPLALQDNLGCSITTPSLGASGMDQAIVLTFLATGLYLAACWTENLTRYKPEPKWFTIPTSFRSVGSGHLSLPNKQEKVGDE